MSRYTLSATVARAFPETVGLVRKGLADQGFGIVSEIDMSGTLKAKLGVDVPQQVILGACRPALAHRALLADPSIAALLPCNVVVRTVDAATTVVEAFDPAVLAGLVGGDAVRAVATDARERLTSVLETLAKEN